MTMCKLSRELLQAWLDGEAGARAAAVERHLQSCSACQEQVAAWRATGAALNRVVDEAIGEVDVVAAAARVRVRIAQQAEQSMAHRVARWWQELWMFHRRALAGVAVAAALGALCAPAAVYLASRYLGVASSAANVAGVIIESMESDTRAVVYRSGEGSTTLIWVEPNDSRAGGDTDFVQKP